MLVFERMRVRVRACVRWGATYVCRSAVAEPLPSPVWLVPQDPSLSQPLIHRCRVCKKMFTTQLALKVRIVISGVRKR